MPIQYTVTPIHIWIWLLRLELAVGMEGALKWVSEVCEWYVTQQGSVGTWMGLGFNLCVVPTLTFCPCVLGRGMNWGLEFGLTRGLGYEMIICVYVMIHDFRLRN